MKTTFTALAACMPLALSGCASIVSQSQYPVTISSVPSGATVVVRDAQAKEIHKAQTPATLTLPAGSGYFSRASYTFEFSKEGHANAQTFVPAMLDPWYVGNIIFGGLIGLLIVDPVTGAMWQLDDSVAATLTPLAGAPAAATAVPPPASTQAEPANGGVPGSIAAPADTVPAATPAPTSVVEQLRTLRQLKDEGVISEEEYERKRAPLLERL